MTARPAPAHPALAPPCGTVTCLSVNGLDPEGVQWVRQLVRALAAEGRTVFLSSHLMSEMAADGATVTSPEAGMLEVSGTTAEHVGEVAVRNGLLLHELSPRRASLEEAYMSLTQDAVEDRALTTSTICRTAKAENQ